ncbi:MAG: asparagine synthase (glutamine-hydrolyzing) [Gammaproteobacteria bacterium]
MCGIAGLMHCGNKETLERMVDVQRHRGPDDAGVEWFEVRGSGLGHRRLSIIDLSPAGHQPMSNDAGTLWITYNGEVYNYREVREQLSTKGHSFRSQSDTEVILKAYETWGTECLNHLNGVFSFAIYNLRRDELFAARDRLGIKPFYYHQQGERLIFASEIKALLATFLVEARPDMVALHTPARFQVSPYTGFERIFKLPPAHYLVFRDGKLELTRYWKIEPREDLEIDETEAHEHLDQLLRDAVLLQMIADVPVGVYLSGGLDSSVISALMKRVTNERIHSFTIAFTPEDQRFEKMPDDSVYAREVAKDFDFVHHEAVIEPDIVDLLPRMTWHLDEPLADPAAINTYLLSKMAREQGIVVTLNGMGGDEVYAGYRKHLACLRADAYQAVLPGSLRQALVKFSRAIPVATNRQGLRTMRWAKRFLSFASLPPLERYLASDLALPAEGYTALMPYGPAYPETYYYRAQETTFAATEVSYLTQMCLNDTLFFLPDHNLTYSDKAAMAAGVETRPPLIDHRLVEYMFTLPPSLRIRRNTQKFLLKRMAESYLPKRIVHRAKAPFGSPLRSWIRGPLAEMVGDLLCETTVKARGIYDPATVGRLIELDRTGQEDNAHVIWTLLTMEVWFRTFFDGGCRRWSVAAPLQKQLMG